MTTSIHDKGAAILAVLLAQLLLGWGFYVAITPPETLTLTRLCLLVGAGFVLLQGRWLATLGYLVETAGQPRNPGVWQAVAGQLIELLAFVGGLGVFGQVMGALNTSPLVALLGSMGMIPLVHRLKVYLIVWTFSEPVDQHPSGQLQSLSEWTHRQARKLGIDNLNLRFGRELPTLAGALQGGGLGPTVVIGQTGIDQTNPRELRSVIAHELGHLLQNDQRHKKWAWSLYTGLHLLLCWGWWMGVGQDYQQAARLLPAFLLSAVLLAGGWKLGLNWLGRRSEYRADQVARAVMGEGYTLARLLQKLSQNVLAGGGRWASHPPIQERVQALLAPEQTGLDEWAPEDTLNPERHTKTAACQT